MSKRDADFVWHIIMIKSLLRVVTISPIIPLYCGACVIRDYGPEYWRQSRVFTTQIGLVTVNVLIPVKQKKINASD